MRKNTSGFTIVELLIVIVVIGILAAIVIVAYNGVQTRANNTKSMAAVNSWAKAIQLYRADKGTFPTSNSCLGSTTTYNGDGTCWDGTYWVVQAAFLTEMSPYISNKPEPDLTPVDGTYTQRRGAFYYVASATDHQIRVMLSGTNTCPPSSAGPIAATTVQSKGVICQYQLD